MSAICEAIEVDGLAPGRAFERAGIARKVSERWRKRPGNEWFDRCFPQAAKKGRPYVAIAPKIERVLELVGQGANVNDAFQSQGISRRRAERWLAEHPEIRNQIADKLADCKVQMVRTVTMAAQSNAKAAMWWLERVFPEQYESALVRQKLNEKPQDPTTIAHMISMALGMHAAAHVQDHSLLQSQVEYHREHGEDETLGEVADNAAETADFLADVSLQLFEEQEAFEEVGSSASLCSDGGREQLIRVRARNRVKQQLGEVFDLMQSSEAGRKVLERQIEEEYARLCGREDVEQVADDHEHEHEHRLVVEFAEADSDAELGVDLSDPDEAEATRTTTRPTPSRSRMADKTTREGRPDRAPPAFDRDITVLSRERAEAKVRSLRRIAEHFRRCLDDYALSDDDCELAATAVIEAGRFADELVCEWRITDVPAA